MRCVRVVLGVKRWDQERNRAKSIGRPGESGRDADEKKTEMAGPCGFDGGD